MQDRWRDIDSQPRLRETTTAAKLDLDACLELAAEIIRGILHDYWILLGKLGNRPRTQDRGAELARLDRELTYFEKLLDSSYVAALSLGHMNSKIAQKRR